MPDDGWMKRGHSGLEIACKELFSPNKVPSYINLISPATPIVIQKIP